MKTSPLVWSYNQQPGYKTYTGLNGHQGCTFSLNNTEINIRPLPGKKGHYTADAFTGYPTKESCDLVIVNASHQMMARAVIDAYIACREQQEEKTIGELTEWAKNIAPMFRHENASYATVRVGDYDLTITTNDDSGTYGLEAYNTRTKQNELTVIYVRNSRIIEVAFESIVSLIDHSIERVA